MIPIDALRGHFLNRVSEPLCLPTQVDNEVLVVEKGHWCRLTFLTASATLVGILPGSHLVRHDMIMEVQLFAPIGEGDKRVYEIAKVVQQAFSVQHVAGAVFRVTSLTSVGRTDSWWQYNVSCPFTYDEVQP